MTLPRGEVLITMRVRFSETATADVVDAIGRLRESLKAADDRLSDITIEPSAIVV